MTQEFRAVTEQERALIEYLLAAPEVPIEGLRSQLAGLEARSDCTCGCPSVALRVADEVAPPDGDSLEITAGCPDGILLLFVRRGRLAGLELAGLQDSVTRWPELAALTPPVAG